MCTRAGRCDDIIVHQRYKYHDVDVNSQVTDDYLHYQISFFFFFFLQIINLVSCNKYFTQPHSISDHAGLFACKNEIIE